ncbi:cytochrome P450 [Halorubrum sp. DTA98]|uniref:cytochrome P450 n=1 Tax=Halorubrum sp. DTA98 TaxID=3402163 RepID=UPI003AAB3F3C
MRRDTRASTVDRSGVPLLGSVHRIAHDPLEFLGEAREYGDLMGYRVLRDRAHVVVHPDAVRTVLVDRDDAFRKGSMIRRQTGTLLGKGIFLAEGDDWRGQRTTMQPAFYREQVAAYGDVMVDHAASTAAGWEDGEVVDVAAAARDLTLGVLVEALFGLSPGEDRELVARAAEAIATRFDSRRVASFLPDWLPTPTNVRYRRAMGDLRARLDEIIAERRAAVEAGELPGTDLLSILVTATDEGGMDDDTLRDNLVTFLFAGHETSAIALACALHALATHPDEQATAADRVAAFGDPAADPAAASERDALEAIDRVIDEALRLYPPVYIFFREPVEDVEIRGHRIPAGSTLSLSPWTCQRDPRWWDEPDAFRPGRWVGGSDRPEYAYFPFGGGPRACIGARFARLELRLVLATLLSRYRFEPVTGELSFAPSANLRPDGSVRLRVHGR